MSSMIAVVSIGATVLTGVFVGLRLPLRPYSGDRLNLLRVIGFTLIPVVCAVLLAKSIIASADSGNAVLSYRLELDYQIATSPAGFYLVNAFKLFLLWTCSMVSVFMVRVYRSQI